LIESTELKLEDESLKQNDPVNLQQKITPKLKKQNFMKNNSSRLLQVYPESPQYFPSSDSNGAPFSANRNILLFKCINGPCLQLTQEVILNQFGVDPSVSFS